MVQPATIAKTSVVGEVSPQEAWDALTHNPSAQLVDVRTHAEWIFAGAPDLASLGKQLIAISWKFYPNFELNTQFLSQLTKAAPDKAAPLYFLCKTGGRSHDAAQAAIEAGYSECYNILTGFEGDPNSSNQRGKLSGWKAASLPWHQA